MLRIRIQLDGISQGSLHRKELRDLTLLKGFYIKIPQGRTLFVRVLPKLRLWLTSKETSLE